jgi:L-rhamnose mutarotase
VSAEIRRIGTVIRLRPEHREEYLRLHEQVWPAVEATIRACNIRNYTIFLHGDLLFGYYEYLGDDLVADLARMAADPTTRRWWALTDPCQERLDSALPGQQWSELSQVWHLD